MISTNREIAAFRALGVLGSLLNFGLIPPRHDELVREILALADTPDTPDQQQPVTDNGTEPT